MKISTYVRDYLKSKTKKKVILLIIILLIVVTWIYNSNHFRTKEELVENFVNDLVDYSSNEAEFHLFKDFYETRRSHFPKYFIDPTESAFLNTSRYILFLVGEESGSYRSTLTNYSVDYVFYENDPLWVADIVVDYEIKYQSGNIYKKDLRIYLVIVEEDSNYYVQTVQIHQ